MNDTFPLIHFCFDFKEGPSGGGNRFLTALRKELRSQGVCTDSPNTADIILFNSHKKRDEVVRQKRMFPDKVFIHRIDGPLFLTRGRSKDYRMDRTIYNTNSLVADGTIFQTAWSRDENKRLGLEENIFESVVYNAPDPDIFYPDVDSAKRNGKTRIVAASIASHERKGFEIYQYLDEVLDFNAYEMTFVGNSPVSFKNIITIPPQSPEDLGDILRQNDIFITASRNDPCSNALIEALHCGLSAVVYNSGGHPELIGSCGKVFHRKEEIPTILSEVGSKREGACAHLPSLEDAARSYYAFGKRIYEDVGMNRYTPKRITISKQLKNYFSERATRYGLHKLYCV